MQLRQLVVAETGEGAAVAVGAEQLLEPTIPVFLAQGGGQAEPVQHAAGLFGDGGGALVVGDGQGFTQGLLGWPRDGGGEDRGGVGRGVEADGAAVGPREGRRGQSERLRQTVALAFEGGEHAAEIICADQAGDGGQGFRVCGGESGFAGCVERGAGVDVLHESEMRGDGGFEREAAEEGLAEGMDGADAHAAGQVEHGGEEGACLGAEGGGGGQLQAAGEFTVELFVVRGDPAAEALLQADGHLGRGGLGVGEAEDPGGIGAGEHEPKQTVDQELGLAGAGVGGDESGDARVGGGALLGLGAGDGVFDVGVHLAVIGARAAGRKDWAAGSAVAQSGSEPALVKENHARIRPPPYRR